MKQREKVLIVDDIPNNIRILNEVLKDDYAVSIAKSGKDALRLAAVDPMPHLILLDIMMPDMDGYEVCRKLKESKRTKGIPILFVTAKSDVEDEAVGLELGAVDYITKPISPPVVKARVKTHMELYLYQRALEQQVNDRTLQLEEEYIDSVYRLTLASEFKDQETGAHIKRISSYTKILAEQLGMDSDFSTAMFYASPMHDLGKVAIPDAILLKNGPLDDEEWAVMKTHTTVGAQILQGAKSPYLKMAIDIARCHHERWDGGGYPRGLKGDQIPLTARIMNICDQYDALRSKRPYKPAFDHQRTTSIILSGDGRTMPDHFDPEVLSAFEHVKDVFTDIYETYDDAEYSRSFFLPGSQVELGSA